MSELSIFGNTVIGDPVYKGLALGGLIYATTDRTFSKATYPGLRAIWIRLVGGGGAGGGAPASTATNVSFGGGGGAGGYAEKLVLAKDLAESETIDVGAGGTGVSGAAGNNGATSSFGAHCAAEGGGGGGIGAAALATTARTLLIAGSGGRGTIGDLLARGGRGGDIFHTTGGSIGGSGYGGSSHYGAGQGMTLEANGTAGDSPGAGGSGMRNNGAQSARTGGAGAAGLVLVELLY